MVVPKSKIKGIKLGNNDYESVIEPEIVNDERELQGTGIPQIDIGIAGGRICCTCYKPNMFL